MIFGRLMTAKNITLNGSRIHIKDVISVAIHEKQIGLSNSKKFKKRIDDGAKLIQYNLTHEKEIYGVTTGLGDSCTRPVSTKLMSQLPYNLVRFHGCGLGELFDYQTSRAILVAQLNSLSKGYSGIRREVMERLVWFLNKKIVPAIPQEGSVGASGDLTPLSYVAAAVLGERSVWENGKVVSVADCYERKSIGPLKLLPKESLSLMNGTAVMTGVACMAYHRANYLAKLSCSLSALMVECLLGNRAHFDARLFTAKPHPGQIKAAKLISCSLFNTQSINYRIQDTYALRCAPAIIGVLFDALEWVREWTETEINSACDNPLLDIASGDILHGGNFYGGHIAFAMDSLKNAVANIADLIDRQVALLLNDKRNRNLPLNLSGADEDTLPANHGFKAVQIACSAWAAESLKNSMPASVFSRSTESHNQDKVSMGTIAARDSIRTLELTEQVAAGAILASTQALDLRIKSGVIARRDISKPVLNLYESIRAFSPMVIEDRPLDDDLKTLLIEMRKQSIPVL